uniref:Potassium/proton antiporter CemA n=1 Tax=Fusochloris perforata TaxID=106203 RepID=A0A097KPQ7_9CHLO|nr:chloroplast enveloppe membrane protein [Fusochloris perforata]AIT95157.1 chloroplast enveloppe membrane protein [Fusochloris perforata]
MQKRAFEQTGLVPRSILRTFDRFRKQLLPGAEIAVLQEFRISRYQVLVSVKSLFILIITPLIASFLTKSFIFLPVAQYIWNTQQNEIFLNSYQENRAFLEMHDFEEKIFFESLINETSWTKNYSKVEDSTFSEKENSKTTLKTSSNYENSQHFNTLKQSNLLESIEKELSANELMAKQPVIKQGTTLLPTFSRQSIELPPSVAKEPLNEISLSSRLLLKNQIQQKTVEVSLYYNNQSIEAISNIFSSIVTLFTLYGLFLLMKPQIIILKSFLTESLYSLNDTTKSFLLILLTDLLVGFHSPRGWEVIIEILLRNLGLPENEDFVLLFVATFPVLLDTVFKYWIFRYLNQISPSTVATYHNMIE